MAGERMRCDEMRDDLPPHALAVDGVYRAAARGPRRARVAARVGREVVELVNQTVELVVVAAAVVAAAAALVVPDVVAADVVAARAGRRGARQERGPADRG